MKYPTAIIVGVSAVAIAASALGFGVDTFGSRATSIDRASTLPVTARSPQDQFSAAPTAPPTPAPTSPRPTPTTRPTTNSASTGRPVATEAESTGVVLISTIVDWGASTAAGTGLVVQADGIVVTNHHVVQGSTQISVTIPQTGRTYDADVLGYSTTEDVAVLRLRDAAGLTTVTASPQPVGIGASITAVGNAGGTGTLVSATGEVANLDRNITATDASGRNAHDLTGLIEISAELVPGDSGGALLDSGGKVVGMNVAGSNNRWSTASYAIPFDRVVTVLGQVLSGKPSDTIVLGRKAALGVVVSASPRTSGLDVSSVVRGGPAARAGVTGGSSITAIDGVALATNADLSAILAQRSPGDIVHLTWTDGRGVSHTAEVTLGEAPLA